MLTSEEVADILGLETISSPDVVEKELQERLDAYQKGSANAGTPKQIRLSYKKRLKELEANKEAIRLFIHSLKVVDLLNKAEETLKNGYSVAVKVYLDEAASINIEALDEETRLRFKVLSAEAEAAASSVNPVKEPEPSPQKPKEKPTPPPSDQEKELPVEEPKSTPDSISVDVPEQSLEKEIQSDDEVGAAEVINASPSIDSPKEELPPPAPVEEESIDEAATAAEPEPILNREPEVEIEPTSPEETISAYETIPEVIPEPQETVTSVETSEIPYFTLTYKNGTRKLHIFNLSEIRIGRSTSNDFIIRVMPYGSISKHRINEANKLISRYHATFELKEGQLSILDGQTTHAGSRSPSGNGIYVNGVKVDTFSFPPQGESTLTLAGLPNNPDIAQWDVSSIPSVGTPPQGIPQNRNSTAGYFLKRFGSLHEDVLFLDGTFLLSNLDSSLPDIWMATSGTGVLICDGANIFDLKGYANKSDKKLNILSVGNLTQDLV
jgi:pSer/pThr/pTyr-binding forkhead associated (FHA) protein